MARTGLGKGLGALIPSDDPSLGGVYREIPIADVVANPHQPRRLFDEELLAGLTASIREVGVLQPVIVREHDGAFELVAGERRWRAAKRAGLDVIPAVVRATDDQTALEHAMVENLHRADLNPLEEAAAYRQLLDDFGATHADLAQRVGKSRAAITNTLRLLQLPPSVQRLVAESTLTAGHARALLSTDDRAFAEALASRIVTEGLSVRATEEAVRARSAGARTEVDDVVDERTDDDHPSATPAPKPRPLRPPGFLELEELLGDRLDTRVSVTMGAKRGKVVIEFADLADLERIYKLMNEQAMTIEVD